MNANVQKNIRRSEFEPKKTIVLDIDGTLVDSDQLYTIPNKLSGNAIRFDRYRIKFRPGARYLINNLAPYFNLAIWTAANRSYAQAIADVLFENVPLEFLWSSEHCEYEESNSQLIPIKPLAKLYDKYPKESVVIVDDTPTTYKYNYSNAIPIESWKGDNKDKYLFILTNYILKELLHADNVQNKNHLLWAFTTK